jgi:DNA polymerase-3 subunit epsilon
MSLYAIYYDTETTGTRSDKDRIVEIAAYNALTKESFCELVNPGIPIPKEASSVHGITDDMVANALSFAEVGKAFINFCGKDAVLIAHNNDAFDRLFLDKEFERHSLSPHPWRYIDTLKWSRKYRPDLPKHALQYLREVFGIAANQAHRALDDVMVLQEVFSQMTGDLSLETILELMTQASQLSKMPFGKHQGKPLSEVPKDYVKWLNTSGAFDKKENEELMKAFEKLGFLANA